MFHLSLWKHGAVETIFPFILIGTEVKGQTLDQQSSEASQTFSRLAHNQYSVAPLTVRR